MVHANLESAVPRSQRSMMPIATIVALSAAVMLSACGRKGPLERPPGAAVSEERTVAPASDQGNVLFPESNEQGKPVAPVGQKRRIPPDWLID
jgi:predicted small lipoprotein YifL